MQLYRTIPPSARFVMLFYFNKLKATGRQKFTGECVYNVWKKFNEFSIHDTNSPIKICRAVAFSLHKSNNRANFALVGSVDGRVVLK